MIGLLRFLPRYRTKARAAAADEAIRAADRARNRGDWSRAARHYGEALAIDPLRGPIWVQYGHTLKEQGDPAQAEAAYRKSLELGPLVADTHLQLGHALKLQGRQLEAVAAYRAALALDPASSHARDELAALERIAQTLEAAPADARKVQADRVYPGRRGELIAERATALLAETGPARRHCPDLCILDMTPDHLVGWAFLPFDFHHNVVVNAYCDNRLLATAIANLRRPDAVAVGPKYNWFQIHWRDWDVEPSVVQLAELVVQRGEDGAVATAPLRLDGPSLRRSASAKNTGFEQLLRGEFVDAPADRAVRGHTGGLSARALVQLYYLDYLGRLPDPEGLQGWVNELNRRQVTLDDFRYQLLTSDEFKRRAVTASDRVGHLACVPFLSVYDQWRYEREPPLLEFPAFDEALLSVDDDAEFLRRCHTEMLGRQPDPTVIERQAGYLSGGRMARLDLLRELVIDATLGGRLGPSKPADARAA